MRDKLSRAESELEKLETKCDDLLEQKRTHLEKITSLQKQVDTFLSSSSVDTRVKDLISNIESQRDAYKYQVQNLIKDLQSKDPNKIIVVERDKPRDVVDNNNIKKKTIVSEPRSKTDRRSAPEPGEEVSVSLELLQVRARLAETTSQLDTARREIISLRSEVESYKEQLQRHNVKQTQTSPTIDRRKDDLALAEAVNELKKKIIELERDNIKLRNAKTDLERENIRNMSKRSDDSVDVVDAGGNESGEVRELQEKIRFLEEHLDKTENNLRNCQNLMSENSKRTLELNSQIIKLRQEEITARKASDDLQLKLDKKDELVRRIVEDKDNLLSQLNEARDKMQQFKSQSSEKTELLSSLDKSRDSLELKVGELELKIKTLERLASDKERRMEEVTAVNRDLEEANRNVTLDNGALRVELEQHKSELERLSDESRGKSDELVDIRSELQRYITEVKRVQELLDIKENDRVLLLTQYEELSKEVNAYEATNRSLGT